MRTFFLILVLVWLPRVSNAQAVRADAIPAFTAAADAAFTQAAARFPEVPGFAVAVVRGDSLVYARGFGTADREAGRPVTPETPFYIASVTKTFTALAASLLAERGVLDLNSTLAQHAPGLTLDPAIHADSVRLVNLLTHTAGLANGALTTRLAYTGEHTAADRWRLIAETRPARARRGTYAYTNLGYNILSVILDRETGTPWQDQLQTLLFTPLGMTRTTAYASRARDAAVPYDAFAAGGLAPATMRKSDATMQAAGGFYASARDLATWLKVQLNDGRLGRRQVLPAGVVAGTHRARVTFNRQVTGPQVDTAAGLGWRIGKLGRHEVLSHGGGFPGAHAFVLFAPGEQVGVAFVANEESVAQLLRLYVTRFALDWWSGAAPDAAILDQARAMVDDRLRGMNEDRARRAQRTWQLSAPVEAYVGTYVNPAYGTLTVTAENGRLVLRIGQMGGPAEPFTRPDAVRIEFVPGQGEVVSFEKDAAGRFTAALYNDYRFVRQAP